MGWHRWLCCFPSALQQAGADGAGQRGPEVDQAGRDLDQGGSRVEPLERVVWLHDPAGIER